MNDRDAAMFQQGVHVMLAYARAAAAQVRCAVEHEHDEPAQTAIDALSDVVTRGRQVLAQAARPQSEAVTQALALIAEELGDMGFVPCPVCTGRVKWARSATGSQPWLHCEGTPTCPVAWTE